MNIVNVDESNLAVYLHLSQPYEAEFSVYTKKTPDEAGLFAMDTVIGGNVKGFLLYIDNAPAGLAAIAETASGHYEVCDFYVVPVFRQNRMGQQFAHQLFTMMPGEWESKQIEGAEHAIAFWRRAIGDYTNDHFVEDIYPDSYWGPVTRQCFSTQKR
ncbi:GNAT family N-acetyltransferase [Photobacterium nomapromontoriensis]|uniref:GNAT family N-acetyltransferase n=1 Tax=Photobacterium nomapromontoriensis TaxID=2910237 RepID=UPI003D0C7C89